MKSLSFYSSRLYVDCTSTIQKFGNLKAKNSLAGRYHRLSASKFLVDCKFQCYYSERTSYLMIFSKKCGIFF